MAYVRAFSRGRYFEAHECLEGLWWRRQSEPLLQGLILFAAAHVQLRRGKPEGARRHFAATLSHLAPYGPRARGLDLAAIRAASELALERLEGVGAAPSTDLTALLPPFAFRLNRRTAWQWRQGPRPLPEAEVRRIVEDAVRERRGRGLPVGPASWGALAKEVARRGAGRVPRAKVRALVRARLGEQERRPQP